MTFDLHDLYVNTIKPCKSGGIKVKFIDLFWLNNVTNLNQYLHDYWT